jgi:cytochrome c oxidase assembly factor CtaG
MTVAFALAHSGVLASAYHGPPALTPVRALTRWAIDPYALAVLAATCGLYLLGVGRVRRTGETWPTGRIVAFCVGGAGLAFGATSSFLSAYWPVLFYVRAVQTVILLLGVPLFVMLGRPVSLAIAGAPRFGQRIQAIVAGRVARVATFPAITAFVLVLTPFVLYFSPWYAAGFHSLVVRELTYLALVLPGLFFFWTLLRVDPVPKEYPYLVALWVTAAEVVGDAALGLSVIADHTLIAGAYYHALARPWGPSLASDQVIGGGALWVLGDVIGLPFLAAVLIAMIREDESQARVIDAELDAEESRRVVGPDDLAGGQPTDAQDAPEAQETPEAPAGPEPVSSAPSAAIPSVVQAPPATPVSSTEAEGLWWEKDPRFVGRFAPVDPDAQ